MRRWPSLVSTALIACVSTALLAGASVAHAGSSKLPYTHLRIGSPTDAAPARLQGGTVLMGGSTDVDAAFAWMCARSPGGDFLVLRASGTDAYNPYVQGVCAAAGAATNSVATLIVPTATAANDSRVEALVRAADAIWIAGGDQSDYINAWKGSKLQAALNQRIVDGVPVGGTSAGLNVLTPFVYTAQASKGVTSAQALADPFNRYLSFDRDFATVPQLAGLIGDPHFAARDRMGRDLAFLCRVHGFGWAAAPRAVAIDEETALLVDAQGAATVVGSGRVYFLHAGTPPEVCAPKTPLTLRDVDVYRIDAAGRFDLGRWTGRGGAAYRVTAEQGVLSSSTGTVY